MSTIAKRRKHLESALGRRSRFQKFMAPSRGDSLRKAVSLNGSAPKRRKFGVFRGASTVVVGGVAVSALAVGAIAVGGGKVLTKAGGYMARRTAKKTAKAASPV